MLKNIAIMFLFILLCLLIGSYWFFASPIAFVAGVWGVIVGSVVLFCIAVLLFFVLTGIGIIILGMAFFIWTVILLISFPFLLPLLLPLLLVLIFISLVRKRQLQKKQ